VTPQASRRFGAGSSVTVCTPKRQSDITIEAAFPLLQLPFRFIFPDSIALLYLPGQLFTLAVDAVQIIVGQLSPLLLGLSLHLLPVALDTIPIHLSLHKGYTAQAPLQQFAASRVPGNSR
jgi:hypothetical protein